MNSSANILLLLQDQNAARPLFITNVMRPVVIVVEKNDGFRRPVYFLS